ncbi:DUF1214 domain-containing protein [Nocardia wallacei]|uniref:DUF1214 domain-containing protein n=1 Tax=Nocardia wallacei TaxID=480035 RepID=UPI0024546286|nr:DUF1214 domain-containing protein [Nocardia wallacei]
MSSAGDSTISPAPPPPVDGFWSLTLYNPEHFFAPNDLGRYSLGTNNKTMKFDPDGTLTLYIQHDSPGPEHEANWLPAPRSEFELTIHIYWPKPQVDNGEWTPPPVVPRTPLTRPTRTQPALIRPKSATSSPIVTAPAGPPGAGG